MLEPNLQSQVHPDFDKYSRYPDISYLASNWIFIQDSEKKNISKQMLFIHCSFILRF